MKTIRGNKDALARDAFLILKSAVEKSKGRINIALCGGTSVSNFYNYIGKHFKEIEGIENAQFFLLDERISLNHRNASMINAAFFNKMIESKSPKRPNLQKIGRGTGEEIARNYTNKLMQFSKSLTFGFIVASAGEDSHIAALAPGHKEISSGKKGYSYLHDSPKFPPKRITLLPKSIEESQEAILFFIDEAKKPAYKLFLRNNNINACPASIIKRIKKSYVLTNL